MFPAPGGRISDARIRSRRGPPCGQRSWPAVSFSAIFRDSLPADEARRQRRPATRTQIKKDDGAVSEARLPQRGREDEAASCRKGLSARPRFARARKSQRRRTSVELVCVSAGALLQVTATDEAERRSHRARRGRRHIAYQRTSARNEEAIALVLLGPPLLGCKLCGGRRSTPCTALLECANRREGVFFAAQEHREQRGGTDSAC